MADEIASHITRMAERLGRMPDLRVTPPSPLTAQQRLEREERIAKLRRALGDGA